jgi:ADP-heptose:LPS heptosyltransferase
MGWATSAKKRIGFNKEGRFFLLTNNYKKPGKLHRTDEYLNLLEQFSKRVIIERTVCLKLDPPTKDKNIVVVNFNSEATSRKMPLIKGKQIVDSLLSNFPDTVWAFVGSGKEKEHIDSILANLGNNESIINYAGKTGLQELCELFLSAKAVLTTDSGPAHLANGLGTPTIVLFGAGDEFNTAPYNKQKLTVLRAGQLDCEPCVRNTCKLYGIPKCMELIDQTQIISALRNYL